ncbi:hypothetical protein MA16_Dca027916 [Dendrobium catenatum]|uniref:Uncharacterized protein n=1 Tax=Dendrobium catenatum TaxID=906689 RepID=A0A2I0VB04_9ASPA|nr:hypothetical protein MA16_Dca027916 [Dendrobium catenatum]
MSPLCFADPEVDHGFLYDDQGRNNLIESLFFDVNLDVDASVEDYLNHILFTLVPSIKEHILVTTSHPVDSPPPATSPTNYVVGTICPLVALLGLFSIFLH